MCPELGVFSNSEYVYAFSAIAIALFWEKGGEEICLSRPLSLVFTILSNFLNTTAVNNYSVRTMGKWSFGDTVLKESGPLAPLGDFGMSPNGPNTRNVGENVHKALYQSLLAAVLATLRF